MKSKQLFHRKFLTLSIGLAAASVALTWSLPAFPADEDTKKRKAHLQQLIPLLSPERTERGHPSPLDETWLDWQKRTGELPPSRSLGCRLSCAARA